MAITDTRTVNDDINDALIQIDNAQRALTDTRNHLERALASEDGDTDFGKLGDLQCAKTQARRASATAEAALTWTLKGTHRQDGILADSALAQSA